MRPIDADALEKEMQEMIKKRETVGLDGVVGVICEACMVSLLELVKRQDVIEAKPVVHAHWNNDGRCTNCGNYPLYDYFGRLKLSGICPSCGAQMDEVV